MKKMKSCEFGNSTIKFQTVLITTALLYASAFAIASYLHPSVIFASNARSLPSQGGVQQRSSAALPTKVRLGWKWLVVTNALAYSNAIFITDAKKVLKYRPVKKCWKESTQDFCKLDSSQIGGICCCQ
jgi:hypothetical protein